MNEQLLTILGIDKALGLDNMIEALEDKYCEYLEREQTATNPERKAEISDIIKKIETEIQNLKENKKSINSAIMLDTGDSTIPAKAEKATNNDNEKIAAMKKKKAELRAVEEKKRIEEQQNNTPVSVPPQSSSTPDSSSVDISKLPLTGDDFKDALIYNSRQQYDKALALFEKESEKGNKEAQFFVGSMYKEGRGAPHDIERSNFWFKKSADNGFCPAQAIYGQSLILKAGYNQALIREGLRYLEKAADSGESKSDVAMRYYIDTVIDKRSDNKSIAKAMEYCDKITEASTDSFEKDQYQKKKVKLKAIKKGRKGSSGGCGGCIWTLLKIIIVLGIIAVIISAVTSYLDKSKRNNNSTSTNTSTTTEATSAPVLGEQIIELHELEPEESNIVTIVSDHDYVVDNSMWNGAFLYRAGNGESTAYTIYDISGLFEKITFEATPYLGDEVFFESSTADIKIVNAETNDILHTQTINYNSGVIEIEADISDINKLGLYVTKTNGMLAYTFIRNVYLYPKGSEPEETRSDEKVYIITGNIRSGAGMEFDSIMVGDGSYRYIATGKTQKSSDGDIWYEIYTDDSKTVTGWCHFSVAKEQ